MVFSDVFKITKPFARSSLLFLLLVQICSILKINRLIAYSALIAKVESQRFPVLVAGYQNDKKSFILMGGL